MLKRLGHSLTIGVSREGLTALRLSRWRGPAATVLAERPLQTDELDDPARLAAALRALVAGQDCQALPLSVVLADDLVRMWQVNPPQGASRLADIEAACALRFQTLFGESMAGWRVASAADWRAPFFAAAMPHALYESLTAFAREAGMPLVSMSPQFVVAFQRWRKALVPDGWFAVVHGGLLTLGVHDGSQLQAVRSLPMPADAGTPWLRAQLDREALRLDLARPQALQCCGQVPHGWVDGDDLSIVRLEPARRGMPAQSNGVALALAGGRA